jgi:ethanolamine ammonia-lyase small subunit
METTKLAITKKDIIDEDCWKELREFTDARIALGHTGASLPTKEMQKFSLAHARARDSVHMPFDRDKIKQQIENIGYKTVYVNSKAPNRSTYLTRPDLGRLLSDDSKQKLMQLGEQDDDITLVIADGLSSKAVHKQSVPLIRCLLPYLKQLKFSIAPVVLAEQSRVALGDEIGHLMHSKFVAMLIGERPGLTSPDSLSVYLTYRPYGGRLESERNCISNIRPEGLSYEKAAFKFAWLLEHALAKECTGIGLKDKSDDPQTYMLIRPKKDKKQLV